MIGEVVTNAGNVTMQKFARDASQALVAVGGIVTMLTPNAGNFNYVTSGYLVLDSDKSFGVDANGGTAMVDASSTLRKVSDLSVLTAASSTDTLRTVDAALSFINGERAKLGALQNRFQSVVANLNTSSENLTASRSRIRDADYAKETAELTRTQILQQAGTAMLAQANQIPGNVLSLLR